MTVGDIKGGNSTVTFSNALRHAGHSCQLIDVTQCVLSFFSNYEQKRYAVVTFDKLVFSRKATL